MNASSLKDVVIVVTTYKRLKLLGELLDVILADVMNVSDAANMSVLVVDNDPYGSAFELVTARPSVQYVLEDTPGIAAARQKALDLAAEGSLLICLDDDVTPSVNWLLPLIDTWRRYSAEVVAGHVEYRLPEQADPWVLHGRFMRRESLATGTSLVAAAAGNMLIDVSAVRRLGVAFDKSLGLSGGEDSLFTTQVTAAGGLVVSCQESVVIGNVPIERTTRKFCFDRARSHGNTAVVVKLRLAPSAIRRVQVRVEGVVGGLVRVICGGVVNVAGRISSDVRRDAGGARLVARGLGMASAAIGRDFEEYRRT